VEDNLLSLALARRIFTSLFLLLQLPRVLPRYRTALVVSAMVTGIAAHHDFRLLDSFRDAHVSEAIGGQATTAWRPG
jgi:hypothetical protein